MNNSPNITTEEWDRIRSHIAAGPAHVHLDTNEDGTMVVVDGFGVMHPRAYLQILEENESYDDGSVDILKNVSNASAPEALIGVMPGSLCGAVSIPKLEKQP
jgi:hypothetical protein